MATDVTVTNMSVLDSSLCMLSTRVHDATACKRSTDSWYAAPAAVVAAVDRWDRQTGGRRTDAIDHFIDRSPHAGCVNNFRCMLPVAVARSSSGVIEIRYVLPVSWLTSKVCK